MSFHSLLIGCTLLLVKTQVVKFLPINSAKKKFPWEIAENAAHNYKSGSHYLKSGSVILMTLFSYVVLLSKEILYAVPCNGM